MSLKNNKHSEIKNRVVKQLYFEKSLSYADLGMQMSKSVSLISKVVSDLIKEGLVIEQGYAPSSGGRKPLLYALQPDGMFILSVAMDQLVTRMVIMDVSNTAVTDMVAVELPLRGNPDAVPQLAKHLNAFLDSAAVPKNKIVGAGIGMPGFVNSHKGINHTFLNAGDDNLREYLSDAIGLPVHIDNDSTLVALAELKFGAAKSTENAMVVNYTWGVGLGVIVKGELFHGHTGFAGEFSHIPIREDGLLCGCGKRGCLETESSLLMITEKAIKEIKEGRVSSLQHVGGNEPEVIADAVMKAAVKGDQYAVELFSDAGYVIGRGLAILIHIMNPEVIIISGRGAPVGKILLASAQQALHRYAIPLLADSTKLTVSKLGYDAELIGAATMVIDRLDRIKN